MGATCACLTAKGSRETEQISNRNDKRVRRVRSRNQNTETYLSILRGGKKKCWKSVNISF